MRPTHTAFIIANTHEGPGGKARWREVGAVWPHRNGPGFDLVIFDQLSVSGRIVCTPRRDRDQNGSGDEE